MRNKRLDCHTQTDRRSMEFHKRENIFFVHWMPSRGWMDSLQYQLLNWPFIALSLMTHFDIFGILNSMHSFDVLEWFYPIPPSCMLVNDTEMNSVSSHLFQYTGGHRWEYQHHSTSWVIFISHFYQKNMFWCARDNLNPLISYSISLEFCPDGTN